MTYERKRILGACVLGAAFGLVVALVAHYLEPQLWWFPLVTSVPMGALFAFIARDHREAWVVAKRIWGLKDTGKYRPGFCNFALVIPVSIILTSWMIWGTDISDQSAGYTLIVVLFFAEIMAFSFLSFWFITRGAISEGKAWTREEPVGCAFMFFRNKRRFAKGSLVDPTYLDITRWFLKGVVILPVSIIYCVLKAFVIALWTIFWRFPTKGIPTAFQWTILNTIEFFFAIYGHGRLVCALSAAAGIIISWFCLAPIATTAWGALLLVAAGGSIAGLFGIFLDWASALLSELVPGELSWGM